jgi:hypothetical protein
MDTHQNAGHAESHGEADGWKDLIRPQRVLIRENISQPDRTPSRAKPFPSFKINAAQDSQRGPWIRPQHLTGENTAASTRTHQRSPQGICRACSNEPAATAGAHTLPTRLPATCGNARIPALCGARSRDGQSDAGRSNGPLHARVALQASTLEVRKTRARARQRRNVETRRNAWDCRAKDRGGVGVGPNLLDRPILDLSMRYSAALAEIRSGPAFQNLAAAFPKNPGRP